MDYVTEVLSRVRKLSAGVFVGLKVHNVQKHSHYLDCIDQ